MFQGLPEALIFVQHALFILNFAVNAFFERQQKSLEIQGISRLYVSLTKLAVNCLGAQERTRTSTPLSAST